jgi:hypothetical protein
LGISTLLTFVPVSLASLHQAGAMTLITTSLWTLKELKRLPRIKFLAFNFSSWNFRFSISSFNFIFSSSRASQRLFFSRRLIASRFKSSKSAYKAKNSSLCFCLCSSNSSHSCECVCCHLSFSTKNFSFWSFFSAFVCCVKGRTVLEYSPS